MFEQGAIGIDGSPSDEQVRELHAVLANAKTDADPELFERKRAGLYRARQKLEAERSRVAVENARREGGHRRFEAGRLT